LLCAVQNGTGECLLCAVQNATAVALCINIAFVGE
jgi:hypothetical protein